MRIVLLYDNFVRDYRGLLLLAEFLKQMGNKVWIIAGWNDPFTFCKLHNVEIIVTGQVGESATAGYGKYASENNIRLVINSSEPLVKEEEIPLIIGYGIDGKNEDIIDLQSIGTKRTYDFILANNTVRSCNKHKYKLIGFPRTDITYHHSLRSIEESSIIKKYNLTRYKKRYLFVSSFLLDGAFDGVSEKDLISWNIDNFRARTEELLNHTTVVLKRFVTDYMEKDDILLIKKHPWDCSTYFNETFDFENCIILENIEFITSCINISDIVINTYSTSAIEAWVMNKPTISIFLEKYLNVIEEHMKYERIAFNYEQLLYFINQDFVTPEINSEGTFAGYMDGKASYRLACEINKLRPKKSLKWNSSPQGVVNGLKYLKRKYSRDAINARMKLLSEYNSIDNGIKKIDVESKAKKNTKYHDFLTWENQRSVVNKLYKKPIKDFVRRSLKSTKNENGVQE